MIYMCVCENLDESNIQNWFKEGNIMPLNWF